MARGDAFTGEGASVMFFVDERVFDWRTKRFGVVVENCPIDRVAHVLFDGNVRAVAVKTARLDSPRTNQAVEILLEFRAGKSIPDLSKKHGRDFVESTLRKLTR